MGLRVIEGGAGALPLVQVPERLQRAPSLQLVEAWPGGMPKGSAPDAVVPSGPCPADVQAEAARRLMTLNIGHWEARHRATGLPVPRDIARKRREIEFVAKALARLNVIPSDYHADVYWPLP